MSSSINISEFIADFIVVIIALGLHEYAHAKMGDLAGDPTPRACGRVTLNPFKHLDPVGTFMIMFTLLSGFGIGWGKPVPLNPKKMKNPRWDHFWAVAAGPISNLLQAAIYASLIRLFLYCNLFTNIPIIWYALRIGVVTNLAICFFNLLPIGPLDGHWLLGTFLNDKHRLSWYKWNAHMGNILLLMVIALGWINNDLNFIGSILRPAVNHMSYFLLGIQNV